MVSASAAAGSVPVSARPGDRGPGREPRRPAAAARTGRPAGGRSGRAGARRRRAPLASWSGRAGSQRPAPTSSTRSHAPRRTGVRPAPGAPTAPGTPGESGHQRREREHPAAPVAAAAVERPPHAVQALLEPPADGARGHAQAGGDVRRREPLVVAEQHRLPVGLVERGDHLGHRPVDLEIAQELLGRGRRRRRDLDSPPASRALRR